MKLLTDQEKEFIQEKIIEVFRPNTKNLRPLLEPPYELLNENLRYLWLTHRGKIEFVVDISQDRDNVRYYQIQQIRKGDVKSI